MKRILLTAISLVPTFRSSRTISACTFHELRKVMGTSKFMIPVPLFHFKFLNGICCLCCRNFKWAALGMLGALSPALGADLPYAKAPQAAAAVYDWTGGYVGVFGGGGFGNHNYNNANGPVGFANFTVNYDSTGGIGGGEVGYNWQSGSYLVGVEADGFWSGIKGSDASQGLGVVDQTNLRWGGTLRARGGFAADRLLLFFTGGWAFGDLVHTSTAAGFPVDQFTNHRSGLTAGGGIGYAITNNIIGKLEYRFYDFGTYSRAGNPLTPNGQLPYSVSSTYSVVTIGFDVKFGGPVVAKY